MLLMTKFYLLAPCFLVSGNNVRPADTQMHAVTSLSHKWGGIKDRDVIFYNFLMS